MPDVSYVIAAYEAADTVEAAIRSALSQVGVTVEVIVVDDASSDGTAAAAGAVDDDRVRVIRLEHNAGPGAARNAGLEVARGEWVGVLDADDVIAPTRSYDMLRRASKAGVDLVVDNILIVDESSGRITPMYEGSTFGSPPRLTLAEYVDGNLMLDRSTPYAFGYLQPMMRRSLLESHDLRYPTHLRIGEDFVFFVTALAHTRIAAVETTPGYRYQARDGSVSSTLRLDNLLAMRAADDELRRDLPLAPDALAALDRRSHSLDQAIAYFRLTQSLRSGDLTHAVRIAREHPTALRHLRIPVEARINRALGRTRRLHV